MLRKLYDWMLRQAEKPNAVWILFFVAFAESSVFPLPPDALLLPMVLANREKAFRFAALCTLGSVLGGLVGYGIGALAMETVGQWIVTHYHLEKGFQTFHDQFNRWGVWIILIKGLTPIPFKLVAIACGVAHLSIPLFVGAAVVARGFRFFVVAALGRFYGEPIRHFVERYLTWVGSGSSYVNGTD